MSKKCNSISKEIKILFSPVKADSSVPMPCLALAQGGGAPPPPSPERFCKAPGAPRPGRAGPGRAARSRRGPGPPPRCRGPGQPPLCSRPRRAPRPGWGRPVAAFGTASARRDERAFPGGEKRAEGTVALLGLSPALPSPGEAGNGGARRFLFPGRCRHARSRCGAHRAPRAAAPLEPPLQGEAEKQQRAGTARGRRGGEGESGGRPPPHSLGGSGCPDSRSTPPAPPPAPARLRAAAGGRGRQGGGALTWPGRAGRLWRRL
ncbi:basic proline-rich protein-like [Cygnus atratus]|uniref:basic proline-rich protein-like n=1 Tax=Cygnus atratus TaxID=8868 RepID=UPI0021B75A56|nr:basic proline-rich protein-like [Cygnus atratus]